jgi:hypothetical protein
MITTEEAKELRESIESALDLLRLCDPNTFSHIALGLLSRAYDLASFVEIDIKKDSP